MAHRQSVLLGISKRGDSYLRTLLIHVTCAVIRVAERKEGHAQSWLGQLLGRSQKNVDGGSRPGSHQSQVNRLVGFFRLLRDVLQDSINLSLPFAKVVLAAV